MLATGACSEKARPDADPERVTTTSVSPVIRSCDEVDTIVECVPAGSMLEPYLPSAATRATGEPITIGTINQDTGAAAAFPELTVADKVAIEFINTELDGVDGRPIELVSCDTRFDPNQSTACAQQMVDAGVVAVIGGIDVWGDGIKVLEDNGIPYVGGIPVSFHSVRSPVSFQFSGGTWGAVLGEAHYAVDVLGADSVAIVHGAFDPITDAAELGERYLDRVGVEVAIVTTPVIGADMVAAMNQAARSRPDAIIALTADSGCVPTIQTAAQLEIDAVLMLTGACAAPKIIESAGDAIEGSVFNLEADLDPDAPDAALYTAIATKYGPQFDYELQGAGTVSFRSVMNLYAALRDIGAANVTRDSILEFFRNSQDRPSFFGHPYTCDGNQLEGLPAICAPQQTLGRFQDGSIVQISDWIDVGALL